MLDTLQRLEELSSHTVPLRLAGEDEANFGFSTTEHLRSQVNETVDTQLRQARLLFVASSVLIIGINLGFLALVLGLAPVVPPYMTAGCLSLVCIFLGFALALSERFRGHEL